MNAYIFYWVMVVLAAIPMPLLLLTWLGWLSPPAPVNAVRIFLLIVATGSYAWLVLAMKFPMFLAESYSRGRIGIILVNEIVMVICSIAAIRGKGRRKVMFGVACILTALVWNLMGAVQSVA
jgi:hypothetical protein